VDANNTQFHLLLGKADWANCMDEEGRSLDSLWSAESEEAGIHWHEERHELILQPRRFQFVPAPKDKPPKIEDRRGAARDRFGNWYWIDKTRTKVMVNSAGTQKTSPFWSVGDWQEWCQTAEFGEFAPVEAKGALLPLLLSALAITEDHYLVVGVLDPAGLLIFDLHSGGPPRQLFWPEEVPFTPFDMAARPGGGVWILDRQFEPDSLPIRYWALDRHFNVITQDQEEATLSDEEEEVFQPLEGNTRRVVAKRTFPVGITVEAASPLMRIDAIAIEALPDGSVLILDRNEPESFSLIYRFIFGRQKGEPVSTNTVRRIVEEDKQALFKLLGHDFTFVPEHERDGAKVPDRLYIAAADGNQAFAFNLFLENDQLRMEPILQYLPMRLFGGKGLVSADTQPYYDFGGRWIPLIEQRRPRYVESGTLVTPSGEPRRAFDGSQPDCVWHRLIMDACIPPETEVRVWSRAANREQDLALAQWHPEPPLYLRSDGSELPFLRSTSAGGNGGGQSKTASVQYGEILKEPAIHGSGEGNGAWELLLQRARGRYLQVKLRLSGNGRTTPRIRAMRTYYPRFSYLEKYLPAVYRDNSESASFLDRFLANFEGLYTSLEDKIAAVQLLFDVRSAPPETLEWLATWFGVVMDPAWDEWRRRLFIKHAMDFFQYRGTIRGLKMALRLSLDDCPDETIFVQGSGIQAQNSGIRVVEKYLSRQTPGVVFGDPTDLGGPRRVSRERWWRPELGNAELSERYKQFLQTRYMAAAKLPEMVSFSIRSPEWQKVPPQQIAPGAEIFVPPVTPEDQSLWQDFLTRRYASISEFNTVHGQNYMSFADVPLLNGMPPKLSLLQDWNEFIEEKTRVWRQFAREALGFAPTASEVELRLWQEFLAGRHLAISALNNVYGSNYTRFSEVPLPTDRPVAESALNDWNDFVNGSTGFTRARNRGLWQDFLTRRYQRVETLNDEHGTNWDSFTQVSLPGILPKDGPALKDWYQFDGVVLAMHRAAHRFTVLLPMPEKYGVDRSEYERRRKLAARIINLEKPAHTIFDVKYYWALFLIGQARLGVDTLLDQGSRAPQLISSMVLGQGYLSEAFLAPNQPQDVAERQILGSDRLTKKRED
jgi:phage tail-like protein